jgi:hypothetical protein
MKIEINKSEEPHSYDIFLNWSYYTNSNFISYFETKIKFNTEIYNLRKNDEVYKNWKLKIKNCEFYQSDEYIKKRRIEWKLHYKKKHKWK